MIFTATSVAPFAQSMLVPAYVPPVTEFLERMLLERRAVAFVVFSLYSRGFAPSAGGEMFFLTDI